MRLTGKCKEDFEKWFLKDVDTIENYDQYVLRSFLSKGLSMQYGVYVDFFAIQLIDIDKIMMEHYNLMSSYTLKDHCRKLAIEQVNEIYNLK